MWGKGENKQNTLGYGLKKSASRETLGRQKSRPEIEQPAKRHWGIRKRKEWHLTREKIKKSEYSGVNAGGTWENTSDGEEK